MNKKQSVRELLTRGTFYLHQKQINQPRSQVELLLAHFLQISPSELYLQEDLSFTEQELIPFKKMLLRKGRGEPWQYIVGKVHFLECSLELNHNVLIPRQETEIFIHQILSELPSFPLNIWDIGTGSGCMGIAIKKRRPDCHLSLSDISINALDVAKENVKFNDVEVEIVEGDLLYPFTGRKAHVILCNPPYISQGEFDLLDKEVRDWEPHIALYGGATGREFYGRLASQLHLYLHDQGVVYFEIGKRMGSAVANLFSVPFWKTKVILKDWAGHDRYLCLRS